MHVRAPFLHWGNVDASDFILGYITLYPLNLRTHLAQHSAGGLRGMVHLISKAAKRNVTASYEWQWSLNGVNFSIIKTTWQSNVAPGTKLYFRRRITLPEKWGGMLAWPQTVSLIIN